MRRSRLLLTIAVAVVLICSVQAQVRFTEKIDVAADDVVGMAFDGANIWVKGSGSMLSAFDPANGEKVCEVALAESGESLAFDGRCLLIAQNSGKKIMAVDRATGKLDLYVDLTSLQSDRDLYTEPLRSGEILGLACGDGRLWVSCGAGYSSSVYEIDPQRGLVISQRFASCPEPAALMYHDGNLWVLDRDNSVLRCLKGTDQLVYDLVVELGDGATALLEMDGALFVSRRGEKTLRGVAKSALSAVVPEKVEQQAFTPFLSKERPRIDGARKVAVLISGDTAATGFNEFWIDVVIMYRILKSRGYNEMYVLYADGRDYSCGWNKYDEKMTDFAATKTEVAKVFNALANGDSALGIAALSPADTLFVYTFDHGASNGHLCLWQSGRYSPTEMAAAMRCIQSEKKFFYMQQCFSGAFKEQFKKDGLANSAIVTACSNSEYAYRADSETETYNGKRFYHGEFNWHFMSALAGETPKGDKVNADTNSDGKVSVAESFEYYKKMNSLPRQTPQQHSNPTAIGETTP